VAPLFSRRGLRVAQQAYGAGQSGWACAGKMRQEDTALMCAINEGDVSKIRLALLAGAEVDVKDERGHTPLMCASSAGHEDAIPVLLGFNPALNVRDSDGLTPLMCAGVRGHESIIRKLLEAGAALDLQDTDGMTSIMFAGEAGQAGAVRVLLEAGAAVNSITNEGITPLMSAGKVGHEGTVRMLLGLARAAVHLTDSRGLTALRNAGEEACLCTLRMLLEAGAAVDSKDNNTWRTTLMHASAIGSEAAVRLLLEAGAKVDAVDIERASALMLASAYGHEASVRVLLEAKAMMELKDSTGKTALRYASEYGKSGAVRVLLIAGAKVDSKDSTGNTPLMWAGRNGHAGAVRVLLAGRAAVDATTDIGGVTALLAAIGFGHLDVVRVLLEAGAEPPALKGVPEQALCSDEADMQQLLALHWDERRARAAAQTRAGREAAEAAAAASADALLAEEEAEKSSAESRQAKTKRKKQRQKTKRAEAVSEPAPAGGARSGPAPPGADPPSQCSDSQTQASIASGAGVAEGRRAAAEQGPEEAEDGVSVGAGRRASQASDGADERGCEEEEERDASIFDPPPVVSVLAEEVLRALETAGSDGEVGEGGFGKVFAAELPSLVARWGRVAVKIASGLQAADILLEVATLRLCRHRNVLPLLGYCDDARAPCMITPLMHGGSLDDRLLLSDGAFERLRRLKFEGDAILDWQQRLSVLCDAARGLAHLHRERILHRDVKTANILLEGALRPLPMVHGAPLLVHRAVLSDVGLAKVREPTLGGTTTHATTRNLAFSTGFCDPALLNSNQHSERTDAFGIGICILMSLVSEPAAGLMKDHDDDVCEAMEDGTGPLCGTAHAVAGWPLDTTRALAALVHGLSMATTRRRQALPEALVQMEALLGAVPEAVQAAQPASVAVGAASAVSRPHVSARGASRPPVRENGLDARAAASAPPEGWSGGELTRMVRQLEVGGADAPLARKRERVTKAYDSIMVRLERVYAAQGHAPLSADEQELRKIDLLAPRHLGRLNGLAHTLRKWWNAAKHRRDQWPHPPSDKEVQRLVREVIAELDRLGW